MVAALLLAAGCTTSRAYYTPALEGPRPEAPPDSGQVYEVILIGDTGAPRLDGPDPVLTMLSQHLQRAGDSSAVVFLGDNIYPAGLPPIVSPGRREAEARIDVQLDVLRPYPGRIVFVPGNHDWADSGPDGLATVRRQEAYIEAALGRGDVFVPSGGFPGPVTIDLTDDIRLVALDTQWWLHTFTRPFGDTGSYTVEEPADMLTELQDVVARSDDKKLVLVSHHPLLSNSSHSGVFAPKYHLFPLTKTVPGAYIPLPILGSVALFYNRIIGMSPQDLSHPNYDAYRQAVLSIIGTHEGLVYAAGHEHNLQYFVHNGSAGAQHVLVSGSGAKTDYTRTGGNSLFASPDKGFMKLRYFADGSVWLEVWSVSTPTAPLFAALLEGADPDADAPDSDAAVATNGDARPLPSFRDSSVVAAVNPDYDAGALRRWLIGDGYRAAWAQQLDIPVLDLDSEAGGLTPVQRGGGAQTRSLRLENDQGEQYVLRSIDKYPARALPEAFRYGLALDIAEEMTSAIHPYGFLLVPPLAEAAGIYHTNPKVVFVPDDPRLGRFRSDFKNQVMMLEERPDEDQTDAPHFGRSENVIGADKLYRELQADNDHLVDQHAFVRARLFDMLIGDWDRHRDQWRWASFEPYELDSTLTGDAREMGKIYRPIPRDRDWAFNNRDGLLFKLARPYVPKIQGFQEDYSSIRGLTTNGAEQDQRFLNALSRSEWIAQAETLQVRLTEEVMRRAVAAWPDEIEARYGDEFVRRLRKRLEKLPQVAERYYEMRARKVDVIGSDKHERFEVTRVDSRYTDVVVYKINSDGEKRLELYRRRFDHRETEEVRLYGFGGDDEFEITGQVWKGVVLRLIGGTGEDTYVDRSDVRRGFLDHTIIYDTPSEINPVVQIEGGPETDFRRADRYPLLSLGVVPQRYDAQLPLVYVFSNTEDGFFVGGGYRWVRQGFLKEPYSRQQMVRANVAPLTGAFNAEYRGHFVGVARGWDAGLNAAYRSPLSIRNFYGLGNAVDIERPERAFYRTRMTQAQVAPNVSRSLLGVARVFVGPSLTFTRFRRDPDRFLSTPQADVSPEVFDGMLYGGLGSWLELDSRDSRVVPRRGFTSRYAVDAFTGLRKEGSFVRITGEMTGYLTSARTGWFTLAPRIGLLHNVGDFPFYQANTLGGNQTLRGYRSDRFAGRTSLYQNVEARLRLRRFSGYVGAGELGLFAFVDNGRVWADDEKSTRWHQGYGGGIWVNALDRVVFNVTTAFSREDRLITFGLGWFY